MLIWTTYMYLPLITLDSLEGNIGQFEDFFGQVHGWLAGLYATPVLKIHHYDGYHWSYN